MPDSRPTRPRGRFAPTPSGPLHRGSLFIAVASWLDVRSRGGEWMLRIDDLDGPRCEPGAADIIRRQLDAHGLHWDGEPRYQSNHVDEYREVLASLGRDGQLFHCRCTRKGLRRSAPDGPDGPVYPGTCRDRAHPAGDAALRLRLDDGEQVLEDRRLGRVTRSMRTAIGDPILLRRDGPVSYQLASTVDDQAMSVTEIVRGRDLLGSSFQQQCIRAALGWPTPAHAHLPLVCDSGGKLSKQHGAIPVDPARATDNLRWCLSRLGLDPIPAAALTPRQLLDEATSRWALDAVPPDDILL